MRAEHPSGPNGAFALVELIAVVVVAGALISVLGLSFENERRLARLGSDEANLGRIGTMTTAYAADHADRFWSFSWQGGVTYNSAWPDLNFAATHMQAAANQAVEILRRRAGRTDIAPITNWLPHLSYGHLVLADYDATPLPTRLFLSSEDRHRLLWAADPEGFDAGLYLPAPFGVGTNSGKKFPFGSSLRLPTVFYDRSPINSRLYQSPSHSGFMVSGGVVLDALITSDVGHPALKVFLHDQNARHFGTRQPYCTHDEARLPLLFADGAVSVRSAKESNPGWLPPAPWYENPSEYNYSPGGWEPPALSGGASDPVMGRFSWTRGTLTESGIVGRDFGAPEVGP